MFSKALAWGREHPIWLGVGVFVVGIALLWLFGFFGRKQQAAAPNNAGAYYAAESAANQAAATQEVGRQQAMVQVAGIESQTEIAKQLGAVQTMGITANRDIELAKTAAVADVANTQSANSLTAALKQFDYLFHVADTHLQEQYTNNATAEHIEAIHANANENIANQASMYHYFTERENSMYKFETAAHLDDTNVALARVNGIVSSVGASRDVTNTIAGYYAGIANNVITTNPGNPQAAQSALEAFNNWRNGLEVYPASIGINNLRS